MGGGRYGASGSCYEIFVSVLTVCRVAASRLVSDLMTSVGDRLSLSLTVFSFSLTYSMDT